MTPSTSTQKPARKQTDSTPDGLKRRHQVDVLSPCNRIQGQKGNSSNKSGSSASKSDKSGSSASKSDKGRRKTYGGRVVLSPSPVDEIDFNDAENSDIDEVISDDEGDSDSDEDDHNVGNKRKQNGSSRGRKPLPKKQKRTQGKGSAQGKGSSQRKQGKGSSQGKGSAKQQQRDDSEDEEDLDRSDSRSDSGSGGVKRVVLEVPVDMRPIDVQRFISGHIINGQLVDLEEDDEDGNGDGDGDGVARGFRKKRYQAKAWEECFANGISLKSKLIRLSRMYFARYFYIPDEERNRIIRLACRDQYGETFELNADSRGYALAYKAMGDWNSNWVRVFHQGVKTLVAKWDERRTRGVDQPALYAAKWSYEMWFGLAGALSKIVDWRHTFDARPETEQMYKTFFTWLCVWEHRSVWGPENVRISREDYLRYSRGILYQPEFEKVQTKFLIWLPARPVGTVRKRATNAKKSHLERIPDFAVIDLNRTQFLLPDQSEKEADRGQRMTDGEILRSSPFDDQQENRETRDSNGEGKGRGGDDGEEEEGDLSGGSAKNLTREGSVGSQSTVA